MSGLAPATRLGPYEIVGPVGAGGMGEVYRARDMRLGREVAVKVLPAEVAADAERVRRFELEARAVAALSHPNILALYDVGSHDGTPFLVTELLEGETLRSRLRRGRLTAGEALELGSQVARGLAAAHDRGVVHRDLKPENLFVTADGTVKILDFGLARLTPGPAHEESADTPTVSVGTAAGAVLGTVGYMSPEQARGRPAGPRSDAFALGCVLYEMLAGERAFRGDTAADTLAAVLTREPPDLETHVEGVPPSLAEVVRRCLRKDPGERFASGREVLEALQSGATPEPQVRPTPRRPGIRRTVVVVGVAAALVAASVLWLRGRPAPGPATDQPDPRRVAVAPFENLTGDPGLDRLGLMAAEAVADGLAGVDGVEVAAPVATDVPTASPGSLRAAASEQRAGTLVTGSCSTGGETLELKARLIDVPSGSILYALEPVSASRDDPQVALRSLREEVAGAVAYHFERSLISGSALRPVPYEAYREFAAAFAAVGFEPEAAREHLERAVELDPEFWMARLRLGMTYSALGRDEEAEAEIAEVAKNEAHLNPAELRALEFFQARRSGRRLEALQVARRIHQDEPGDRVFGFLAANTALTVNRPREALTLLGPLVDLDWNEMGRWPQGSFFVRRSALAHHLLGDYEAELSDVRLGLEHYPGLVSLREDRVRALAALGRVAEVEATIEESLTLPARGFASAGTVMLEASEELRAHGHPAEAARVAERAAEWYAGRPAGDTEGSLAGANLTEILWMAERYDDAREAAEAFARESPKNVHAQGLRGVTAARCGDRAAADGCDRRLAAEDRPIRRGYASYWRACIAAQRGDRERAVELLREAFSRGMPFDQYIHRYVYLEPLHGHPPFEELITPKG